MNVSVITSFRSRKVVTELQGTGKLIVGNAIEKRVLVVAHELVYRMNGRTKVVFHIERDAGGYPPEEWEGIWALPLADGRYRIDNIPFFVRGISLDDIVLAQSEGGEARFKALLEPSENSTIRIIIYDATQIERVRADLRAMGCSSEGTGIDGLLSVNVPKASATVAFDYIHKGFESDRWDYEEGVLRV